MVSGYAFTKEVAFDRSHEGFEVPGSGRGLELTERGADGLIVLLRY